jgi:hypothetical protein
MIYCQDLLWNTKADTRKQRDATVPLRLHHYLDMRDLHHWLVPSQWKGTDCFHSHPHRLNRGHSLDLAHERRGRLPNTRRWNDRIHWPHLRLCSCSFRWNWLHCTRHWFRFHRLLARHRDGPEQQGICFVHSLPARAAYLHRGLLHPRGCAGATRSRRSPPNAYVSKSYPHFYGCLLTII